MRWPCLVLMMLFVGTVQTDGASPLYVASQNGHVEVVRALLGAGADVGQVTVSRGFSVAKCVGYGVVRRVADAECSAMCGWFCVVRWWRGLFGWGGWCDGRVWY